MAVVKNKTWKKGKGDQYHLNLPIMLRLWGRILSGTEGKETEICKIKIVKNWDGEEYQVFWNFIHPCLEMRVTGETWSVEVKGWCTVYMQCSWGSRQVDNAWIRTHSCSRTIRICSIITLIWRRGTSRLWRGFLTQAL